MSEVLPWSETSFRFHGRGVLPGPPPAELTSHRVDRSKKKSPKPWSKPKRLHIQGLGFTQNGPNPTSFTSRTLDVPTKNSPNQKKVGEKTSPRKVSQRLRCPMSPLQAPKRLCRAKSPAGRRCREHRTLPAAVHGSTPPADLGSHRSKHCAWACPF